MEQRLPMVVGEYMKASRLIVLALIVPLLWTFLGGASALAQPATDATPTIETDPERTDPEWTVHARPVGEYQPVFAIGRPIRSDGLPRHLVMRLMRKALWIAAPCYERALADLPAEARPSLAGVVHARFAVTTQGRPGYAGVTGDVPATLRMCLAAVFRRLRFPKSRACGIAMVEVPIEMQVTGRRSNPARARSGDQ